MIRIKAKLILGIILTIGIVSGAQASKASSLKGISKKVIKLSIPVPKDSAGGVITAYVDAAIGDGPEGLLHMSLENPYGGDITTLQLMQRGNSFRKRVRAVI